MQLRDYQKSAINNIRKSIQNDNKSVLLALPTGAGKTVIFSEITKLAKLKGSNVLILVHRKELIDQASNKLKKNKVNHGIIASGYEPKSSNVQVASVQTLIRRLNDNWQPNLIILDEAHHAVARSWRKILDFYKNTIKLGVTATPMRMTGAGLGEVFDDLIVGTSIPELVDKKFLAPHEVYAPPNKLNLDKIRTIKGDFAQKEVENEFDRVDIVGDAVQNYKKLADNKPAIAFCISVKHGKYVTNKFKQAGYKAELITGDMSRTDRDNLTNRFKKGKLQILVSIDVVSEGFDVENCSCAILLRPTQSEALYIQQVGRVLRPEPNKTAIVLDHVGNTKRHGFVDDIRHYDLNQKAKTKRKGEVAPQVETCEVCFAVYKPQASCPVCGHVREIKKREIIYKEGELVKMKKNLNLQTGDPIIEISTGAKLYFFSYSDDYNKTQFKLFAKPRNTFAQCFYETQWKEFKLLGLDGIYTKTHAVKQFLKLTKLAEVELNDIRVDFDLRTKIKKQEEAQCKTLDDWYKLAKKRGHNPYWAKKRWELRKYRKGRKINKKLKGETDNQDYFNF